MSKTVIFRFATPDPLKFETKVAGKSVVKRRTWDGEKLFAYFSEHFPEAFAARFPDQALVLEHTAKPAIRLEGWKYKTDEEDALKEQIAELAGEIMQDIEPEEFLKAAAV